MPAGKGQVQGVCSPREGLCWHCLWRWKLVCTCLMLEGRSGAHAYEAFTTLLGSEQGFPHPWRLVHVAETSLREGAEDSPLHPARNARDQESLLMRRLLCRRLVSNAPQLRLAGWEREGRRVLTSHPLPKYSVYTAWD